MNPEDANEVKMRIEDEKNIQREKKPFPISLDNRSGVLGELFQQLRTGGNSHLSLNADYIFVTLSNL